MNYRDLFNEDCLGRLFPDTRTNAFFDALLGDADDGAYDIALTFQDARPGVLEFAFALTPRNGKCLACHLTHGLPEVFARHPVINVKQLVAAIGTLMPSGQSIRQWELGRTMEINASRHHIPLRLFFGDD